MRNSRSRNVRAAWWLTFLSVTLFALFFDAHPAATAFPTAELRIYTRASPPSSVPGGSDVTYTMTITNNGPQDANNMVVRIVLAGTVIERLATYTNPGPPSKTENCAYVANSDGRGGTVTCSIGTLFVSPTAPATVVLRVTLPTVTFATNISDTVTIMIDERVMAGSDSRSLTFSIGTLALPPTSVTTDADLAVTKVDAPDPTYVASNLTYTITLANNGPVGATNVMVIDTLPPTVSERSWSFARWSSAHPQRWPSLQHL